MMSASITPLTSNTTMRGPLSSSAACRLPGPVASSVVTLSTRPPRPPLTMAPNPSAPGKARTSSSTTPPVELTVFWVAPALPPVAVAVSPPLPLPPLLLLVLPLVAALLVPPPPLGLPPLGPPPLGPPPLGPPPLGPPPLGPPPLAVLPAALALAGPSSAWLLSAE